MNDKLLHISPPARSTEEQHLSTQNGRVIGQSLNSRGLLKTDTAVLPHSVNPTNFLQLQNTLPQRYSVVDISPKIGKLEKNLGPPKGEDPARMAAGTSRIVRYILFAFFVSQSIENSQASAIDDCRVL